MASNVISNLVPVLVPIVAKIIDSLFSEEGTVTPPEIREKRQRLMCHCKTRGETSRHNSNQCNTCNKPYSRSNVANKQYLDIPSTKTRSMSSSDSYKDNNDKLKKKSMFRGRSLSDSHQKHITNEDTLIELNRRLQMLAKKSNDSNPKRSIKASTSSSSSSKRF